MFWVLAFYCVEHGLNPAEMGGYLTTEEFATESPVPSPVATKILATESIMLNMTPTKNSPAKSSVRSPAPTVTVQSLQINLVLSTYSPPPYICRPPPYDYMIRKYLCN